MNHQMKLASQTNTKMATFPGLLTSARRTLAIATILLTVVAISASGQVVLEVELPDTTVESSAQGVTIPIYMRNHVDTVSGFVLQLFLDQPDIIDLRADFETSGTLVENWEYVQSNQLGGQSTNLRLVGLAELGTPPITPGIAPQVDSIPLIKIKINVHDIPDTAQDRTVNIHISHNDLFNFGFSDPQGNLIGTIRDSIQDTIYWNCLVWEGDTCTEWEWLEEPINPDDSFLVIWVPYSYLDLDAVIISDGSIMVTGGYICGDVDGNGSGPDIADLVYLVQYMFSGGPAPTAMAATNCAGGDGLDIADLVCFVNFMFSGGDPPLCGA